MSVSSRENKQLRSFPSEVSRRRLQLRQKGRVTEAMKPTRWPSVNSYCEAGARESGLGHRAERTPFAFQDRDHLIGGKNSVESPDVLRVERHELDKSGLRNRFSRAKRTIGTRSGSVRPFIATALSFTLRKPGALSSFDAAENARKIISSRDLLENELGP